MCGINGIVSVSGLPIPTEFVAEHRRISTAMSYRGPDGGGEYVSADHRAALFARQFVVTGSGRVRQPLHERRTRITASINGEVYNYAALDRSLTESVPELAQDGDVEMLVRAFGEKGTDAIPLFRGMFALAVLDETRRQFVLARDRFGERPLFYIERNGLLHYASEANYLLRFSERRVDRTALAQYLTFGFCWDYLVEGVQRLEPGSMLLIADGQVESRRYWSPSFTINYEATYADSAVLATERIRMAVQEMIPAVPYGCFVSGGLDSSIIAQVLARRQELPLFTAGLIGVTSPEDAVRVDGDYRTVEIEGNELQYADALAASGPFDYHRREFTVSELIHCLPRMVRHLPGGPVVSTSFPVLYFVADASRQCRVCFSGEGSDELHGGYATSQPEFYQDGISRSFLASANVFSPEEVESFLGRPERRCLEDYCDWLDKKVAEHCLVDGREEDNLFSRIRYFMLNVVMCRHIIEKGDGMTMQAGPTEIRMPFLSPTYSEYALTLPLAHCRTVANRKALCARLAESVGVPNLIVGRTQKQRTTLPYFGLFYRNTDFAIFTRSLFGEDSRVRDILNIQDPTEYVYSMTGRWNAHRRAWALLVLELWLREVFDK